MCNRGFVSLPLTSAAIGSKMEGGGGTLVTVTAYNVGATLALSAVGVTHGAERALRVTLAFWEMESKKIKDKRKRTKNRTSLFVFII